MTVIACNKTRKFLAFEMLSFDQSKAEVLCAEGIRAYEHGVDNSLAFSLLQEAIGHDCSKFEYYVELCEMYRAEGLFDDALRIGLRGFKLFPKNERVGCALGFLYYDRGEMINAITTFRKVLRWNANSIRAKVGLGSSLLVRGDWKAGWAEFVQRDAVYKDQLVNHPRWDGANAFGRTLLLIGDGGLGDTIQFMRYIPQVAKFCGKLIVLCRPEVRFLILQLPLGDNVVVDDSWSLPHFDVYHLLMDVPGVLFHSENDFKSVEFRPYLSSTKKLVADWRSARFKIGFVFSGSTSNVDNFRRSIDLCYLKFLIKVPDTVWISLHKDAIENYGQVNINIDDFEDTMAIIENLDLVISVDSAVAHVAGAMGKPVWLLLPYSTVWRWPKAKNTHWYPPMRLFRQSRPNRWDDVIDEVKAELLTTSSIGSGGDPEPKGEMLCLQ